MPPKIFLIVFFILATTCRCIGVTDVSSFQILDEMRYTYLKVLRLFHFPEAAVKARRILENGVFMKPNSFSKLENGSRSQETPGRYRNANETFLSSEKCAADIAYMLVNMNKRWVIQILDANAKISSGMVYGNFLWIGNYRECVETFAPPENGSIVGNFHGQYCLTTWDIHLPDNMPASQLPLLTGICIPDSCNATVLSEDFKSIFKLLRKIEFVEKHSSVLTLRSATCSHMPETLNYPAIWFVALLCTFGILVVTGTCITLCAGQSTCESKSRISLSTHFLPNGCLVSHHVEEEVTECLDAVADDEPIFPARNARHKPPSKLDVYFSRCCKAHMSNLRNVVECFSLTRNGNKILNTETSDGQQLLCLHGIRFFSMAWIILGHTYVHCLRYIDNIVNVIHDLDNWPAQVILHGTFSVDSFFLISGFLLTYLYLKKADTTSGSIPWKYIYLHRYLRLTPPYAVLIGFNTLIFDYLGSGPFWGIERDAELCKANWWWNLLYINNFLSMDNLCVAWTWYLANDMQFFIISSLFLYVLWRWPKLGIGTVVSLLLSSWIATWIISDRYEIKPMFYGLENSKNYTAYQKEIYETWDKVYSKPYCRIGPYLIGVILAHVLHRTGDTKRFLKWWQLLIGWSLACWFSFSVLCSFYKYAGNQLSFNFYNAMSRSSFSLGVAWVIYLCLTEHAGTVNAFLSYKLWIPLSRLTYCTYLIHPLLMEWYFQRLKEPLHFTHTVIVMHFFGFLLFSYGIGFLAALVFEAPIRNFEKLLTRK